MKSISESVAFITGAGSGIGRAVAVTLAQAGCHVALVARRADELGETARLCKQHQVQTLCLPTDITDAQALATAIEQCVTELGSLNILINNADIFDWASALEVNPDVWDRLIDINLRTAMRTTRLALPLISRQKRGAIVFIVSMAEKMARMNAAYVASKHAIVGFAGSVFEDVRECNIKVCAICPGLVSGSATAEDLDNSQLIQPEDVAAAVQFVVTFPDNACPTEILLQPQSAKPLQQIQ